MTGGALCKTLGIIKKCITFGRAAEGLRADFQKQLLQLQREIGFSYVRFHGIFHDDMAVYREDQTGEPAFWFGYVDSLMDFLLSAGLKPILELGFMPKALARVPDAVFWWHANGSPPKSEQKWCRLVEATLRHFANATATRKCENGILKCGMNRI